MEAVKILEGVHWVGALDPDLRVFDVIMRAEHGTSYNSYLVRGTDKVALIDVNKKNFAAQHLERIRSVIDPAEIDYIVMNHMEPDHSGALNSLLELCPKAVVYCTRPGLVLAKNVVNRDFPSHVIADGETLDLGGRTLRFLVAPYLHWPDTMFTELVEDKVLFTCDFLGAHYCDERVFNDLVPHYDHVLHYYFQAIMRPFKEHVRSALEKVAAISPVVIAPSHGPVLRSELDRLLELYREWSKAPAPRTKKRLLVFYASAYGSTETMAKEIVRGAEEAGAEARTVDLTGGELHNLVDEVEDADGIAVGSCTINGDALEHAWSLLAGLSTINVKKKLGASFGSYGWSGEGPKMLTDRLKGLRFRVPEEPIRVQLFPTAEDLENCRRFGAALAAAL